MMIPLNQGSHSEQLCKKLRMYPETFDWLGWIALKVQRMTRVGRSPSRVVCDKRLLQNMDFLASNGASYTDLSLTWGLEGAACC